MTIFSEVFDTRIDTTKLFVTIKTKFVLRQYINSQGKSPLYIFISSPGSRKREKTEIEVAPTDWDAQTQRVLQSDPLYKSLNLIIENLIAKITKIRTIYMLADKQLSAEKIVVELKSSTPRVDFITYFEHRLKFERPMMAHGYYKRVRAVLAKLKAFRKEILFSDVDHNLIDKYRRFYADKGNETTTINGNVAMIKKMLSTAEKDGIKLPIHVAEIKVGNKRGNRIDLSPQELKKAYDYYFSPFINDEWKLVLGYFLFSCFTSIRWEQVIGFKRQELLSQPFVNYYIGKSHKRHSTTMNESALKIIAHCPDLFVKKLTNQHVNRELKNIMSKLSINRNVSFHVARHTFATNFIRMGGGVVKLKKIMAHSKVETTMIYVHIVEQEASADMALMDALF